MKDHDKQSITRWNESLTGSVSVRIMETDDQRSAEFIRFGEILAELAPGVRVQTVKGAEKRGADSGSTGADDEREWPEIQVGDTISFHGLPLEGELEPFLGILALTAEGEGEGDSDSGGSIAHLRMILGQRRMEKLARIQSPATIELYVSQFCPHCPATLLQLAELALAGGGRLRLKIVDCGLFPEAAKAEGIRSTPTVLLENGLRWSGNGIRTDEILEQLAGSEVSDLSPGTISEMASSGAADQLAGLMIKAGDFPPAFLDLLAADEMDVRIGAMVAMETVIEKDPELAARAAEPLWERYDTAAVSARGDILYLIGETGGPEFISRIELIAGDTGSADLAEAASEALEQLRERHGYST